MIDNVVCHSILQNSITDQRDASANYQGTKKSNTVKIEVSK